MKMEEEPASGFSKFRLTPRKALRLSSETMISTRYFDDEQRFPLLIEPRMESVNLVAWAQSNREMIERELLNHGALLFRNFNLSNAVNLELFIKAASGQLLEYQERSSPRSHVSGNIYTSTDYPSDQSIFLHNEQSYNTVFPKKIVFFCVTPAQQGGETPIADTRRIFARISPPVREQLMRRNYMYVRNFGDGFGLSWQAAFQTTDKHAVEAYCRANDIRFQWKDGNRLRTSQVRQTVARHPHSGDIVWFNHLTFFHISTLESRIRHDLLAQFTEEELPNNTYYGDGATIEPAVMDELREAYLSEKVTFRWQAGDILMLDNMLASHGREPFVGERRVLVGMSDTQSWEGIGYSG